MSRDNTDHTGEACGELLAVLDGFAVESSPSALVVALIHSAGCGAVETMARRPEADGNTGPPLTMGELARRALGHRCGQPGPPCACGHVD